MEIKAACDLLQIPAMNSAEIETGRFVRIRHYPATNYKPRRVFAVWSDHEGGTVRRRLDEELDLPGTGLKGLASGSERLAIQAAGKYLEWLTESAKVGRGNDFFAVLTRIAFAYDGAGENESGLVVFWRDGRGVPKWETDPVAEKAREIESQFKRLNNDTNGNPRYWIHDMGFPDSFDWRGFGFQSYRGKQFGGGYTVSTYNLRGKSEEMAKAVCGKGN